MEGEVMSSTPMLVLLQPQEASDAEESVRALLEVKDLDHVLHHSLSLLPRHRRRQPQSRAELKGLAGGRRGAQRVLLRDVGDVGAELLGVYAAPVDGELGRHHVSVHRHHPPAQHVEQRRLPASARAHDRDHLPGVRAACEVLEHSRILVTLGDCLGGEREVHLRPCKVRLVPHPQRAPSQRAAAAPVDEMLPRAGLPRARRHDMLHGLLASRLLLEGVLEGMHRASHSFVGAGDLRVVGGHVTVVHAVAFQ
eukprot:159840-Hanusia_phi.AAC.2